MESGKISAKRQCAPRTQACSVITVQHRNILISALGYIVRFPSELGSLPWGDSTSVPINERSHIRGTRFRKPRQTGFYRAAHCWS